jgi:hypothetical protein
VGFAGSFKGDAVAEIVDPLFVLVKNSVLFRAEPSWGETIHRDAVLAPAETPPDKI